jgi:HNH endonuclease
MPKQSAQQRMPLNLAFGHVTHDPRKGLALCTNAHWLFDKGLWTELLAGDKLR